MTGYAQASADLQGVRMTVEVRTLNHRYAELRLRLPAGLAAAEGDVRRRLLERIRRGRVELSVRVDAPEGSGERPVLNRPLLETVLSATKALQAEFGIAGAPEMSTILAVPGMFGSAAQGLAWGAAERAIFDGALDAALEALEDERRREGRHLVEELLHRVTSMQGCVGDLRRLAGDVPALLQRRLAERLRALAAEVPLEPTRLAQEAAFLADRGDVTEELVRLEGHLEQARHLLERPADEPEPVGRRLDFLLQEIHRETNTVGSKSATLELSRTTLALKAELEKAREQVQNLE
jgi:uncharacterized protein (TIGR00255 family)